MDKRQAIFDSALQLFVEFGFHGTPTSKIAKNAGVSNGILFHYFGTKEELIKELYIAVKEELNGFLQATINADDDIETRLKKVYLYSVYWGLEHPEKFHYIQQIHFSPHISQISQQTLQEQMQSHISLIERAKALHIIRQLPTDLVYTLAMSHVIGIYTYARTLKPRQQKLAIETSFTLFWDMITEKDKQQ
jgi:AcrR family transcriptional regulator